MPGWLGLPPIQQPSCPLVYDWFGWSGQVQEGHSFRWWHLTVLSKAVRQPASRLPSVHCCWIFFHYIVILHGTMVDILESMILFCLLVQPVLSKQIHPHLIFHVWTGILQHPWKFEQKKYIVQQVNYSNPECMAFNTNLFRRPPKRWPTHRLNAITTLER